MEYDLEKELKEEFEARKMAKIENNDNNFAQIVGEMVGLDNKLVEMDAHIKVLEKTIRFFLDVLISIGGKGVLNEKYKDFTDTTTSKEIKHESTGTSKEK